MGLAGRNASANEERSTKLPSSSPRYPDQSASEFGTWLNMIVRVGFFEEIPCRGLVFQKLNELLGFWPASLLGSFVFVCLHVPYWISLGTPLFSYPYTALYIFEFA
jgi:membrane protease YdiL (CAAX protease family)